MTNALCVTDFEELARGALGASPGASAVGAALARGACVSCFERALDVGGIQSDIEGADDELDYVSRFQAAQAREHLTHQASLGLGVGRRNKVVGPVVYLAHRDAAR